MRENACMPLVAYAISDFYGTIFIPKVGAFRDASVHHHVRLAELGSRWFLGNVRPEGACTTRPRPRRGLCGPEGAFTAPKGPRLPKVASTVAFIAK